MIMWMKKRETQRTKIKRSWEWEEEKNVRENIL